MSLYWTDSTILGHLGPFRAYQLARLTSFATLFLVFLGFSLDVSGGVSTSVDCQKALLRPQFFLTSQEVSKNQLDEDKSVFRKAFYEAMVGESNLAELQEIIDADEVEDLERASKLYQDFVESEREEVVLNFNWKFRLPDTFRRREDGRYQVVSDKRTHRMLVGLPWEPDRVFESIHTMSGWSRYDWEFHHSIFSEYEGQIREEVLQALKVVEESLPENRISNGIIFEDQTFHPKEEKDPKALGTLRVYDGSRVHGSEGQKLPFQRMMKIRDLKSDASDEADSYLSDVNKRVFELGKYTVDGNSKQRRRIRRLIFLTLYHSYALRYPDATFYIHVASLGHVRLYQRYGFQVIESISIPKSSHTEYILSATGQEFADSIVETMKLPLLRMEFTDFNSGAYFDQN